MIEQLSVLLSNEKGRLAQLTRALGEEGINMHALTTADTAEFGVIRIICDRPQYAVKKLRSRDFSVTLNKVVAIEVSDRAGGLADVFELLDANDIDIEYSYCFATSSKKAADVLKSSDPMVETTLKNAGILVYAAEDLYIPDARDAVS